MPRTAPLVALVWRRDDFSESSRVVTLLTREHGRVRAFAKGGHRADSVLLGRVDFLNLLRVDLWRRGDTMPLLARADLLYEPRGLRQPARFLVIDYLTQLVDAALLDEHADPALSDLVHGGLALVERCPTAGLATVLCGLEWRFLLALGLQPEVDACAETAAPLPPQAEVALAASGRGFVPRSAEGAAAALIVRTPTRDALRLLGGTPGKSWPELSLKGATIAAVLEVLGYLVAAAIERVPSARAAAIRAVS